MGCLSQSSLPRLPHTDGVPRAALCALRCTDANRQDNQVHPSVKSSSEGSPRAASLLHEGHSDSPPEYHSTPKARLRARLTPAPH